MMKLASTAVLLRLLACARPSYGARIDVGEEDLFALVVLYNTALFIIKGTQQTRSSRPWLLVLRDAGDVDSQQVGF